MYTSWNVLTEVVDMAGLCTCNCFLYTGPAYYSTSYHLFYGTTFITPMPCVMLAT